MQVSAALQQDFHFTNLSGNKWGLAVYKTLRWGLAGASNIAADFAEVLALVPGAQLAAVAVRSQNRFPQAQAFAEKHGMLPTSALGCLGSLIQRPANVLVAYVAFYLCFKYRVFCNMTRFFAYGFAGNQAMTHPLIVMHQQDPSVIASEYFPH